MTATNGTGPLMDMQEWIIKQWLAPGPGRGHWYECRRVQARTWGEACDKAFPEYGGNIPHGYKVEIA